MHDKPQKRRQLGVLWVDLLPGEADMYFSLDILL